MRKFLFKILPVVAIVAAIAVAMNPGAEAHREQIKDQLAERSQFAKILLVGPITAFASNYHSIGVASYTTVQDRTVSIGAFGMVFVLDQKD